MATIIVSFSYLWIVVMSFNWDNLSPTWPLKISFAPLRNGKAAPREVRLNLLHSSAPQELLHLCDCDSPRLKSQVKKHRLWVPNSLHMYCTSALRIFNDYVP